MTPKGLPRRHPICLALVPGGQTVWDTFLRGASTVGVVNSNGAVSTLESKKSEAVQAEAGAIGKQAMETGKKSKKTKAKGKKEVQEVPGIGVRRRYYFTSNGVRISNLIVT
ncbi:hypothetical protein KCU98_g4178, partial [Aureobasidium melanogenum]